MSEIAHTTASMLLPEQVLVTHCIEHKFTFALAESCTGGMIAARITSISGSSEIFNGGVVCYANAVKHDVLGVPQEILETNGAVSAACAKAMAEGARKVLKATIAVSVTGIAGPKGGTPEKPVGLVFIGVATESAVSVEEHIFSGDRESIRKQAADAAVIAALRAANQ